jgi:hypothetical protein
MLRRCRDPNRPEYPHYGGRGIGVCERWAEDFGAFYTDMGTRPSKKHTIERRNNDLGYSPENCYWATRAEQSVNKRTNHYIVFMGEKKTIGEWEKGLGLKSGTLVRHITTNKRTMEEAIERIFLNL